MDIEGLPEAIQRILRTPHGPAIGASFRQSGGQYCADPRGVVGCGISDISRADQFGMAFALSKGTAEHPLREPEDLYDARTVLVSKAARSTSI